MSIAVFFLTLLPAFSADPLTVRAPSSAAAPTVLVPVGATWSYLDDGTNQMQAWRAPGFDDSGWAQGPAELGYGDGDEATVVSFGPDPDVKHVTTYFRHRFQVADPGAFVGLELQLLRDDGAVCFLNGVEVVRSNMPSGTIGFIKLADSTISGIEEDRFHVTHPPVSLLVTGENVLAIEIHQRARTSSDISFDLQLTGLDLPDLARGPYLQLGTATGVTVRWRSTSPTDARVRYGTNPGLLDQVVLDPTVGTEHAVRLTGLDRETTYYYSVGTGTLELSSGLDHTFTTAPRAGARKPFRAWILGDSGTADPNQDSVRNAYEAYVGSERADLVLMLGDNAYERGSDEEYQLALFEAYADELLRAPFWPARGNHEDFQNVYLDMFSLPTAGEAGGVPSGSELYYSFDHANVHFVCLDSDSSSRAVGGAMWTWLQSDLMATTQDWIVAYWHHPPYSKGSHDSDLELNLFQMRQNFLPLLEEHGVDLVFSGHSHSYERSFFLDGHYGNSLTFGPAVVKDGGDGMPAGDGAYRKRPGAHNGAVYCVAGSSGKITAAPLDHPAMFFGMVALGSVLLDVDDDRIDVTFLSSIATVLDSFTIEKPRVGGLYTQLHAVSAGAGGTQSLVLDGGLGNAGAPFVLVSRHGTAGGETWVRASGRLDEVGTTEVGVTIEPGLPASLVGEQLEHELLVFDAGGERVVFRSAAVPLRILP